jgi:hypothetical protein
MVQLNLDSYVVVYLLVFVFVYVLVCANMIGDMHAAKKVEEIVIVQRLDELKKTIKTRLAEWKEEKVEELYAVVLHPATIDIGSLKEHLRELGYSDLFEFSDPEKAKAFIDEFNTQNTNKRIILVINKLQEVRTEDLIYFLPDCEFAGDVLSSVPNTASEIWQWV